MGSDMGGPPGHGGGGGHLHQGGPPAVPGLRGLAGLRRAELGLEPGGQPPAAQRRRAGELPCA